MGSPGIFYKRALQCFVFLLFYMKDEKLAKQLCEEGSIEKLENIILNQKNKIVEKEFFFYAGDACRQVIDEADEEGIDSFNAACGWLYDFEHFIGLIEDEDDNE